NRNVAAHAERERVERQVLAAEDVPFSRRIKERYVCLIVARVIAGYGPGIAAAELNRKQPRSRSQYPPLRAVRSVRPEDPNVDETVAVIICRYRLIARDSESRYRYLPIRRPDNIPGPGRRPVNRSISLPVAVIISRSGNISIPAERERVERKIFASQEEPLTARRPKERHIRLAVAGVIRRCDHVTPHPEHGRTMPAVRARPIPPFTA